MSSSRLPKATFFVAGKGWGDFGWAASAKAGGFLMALWGRWELHWGKVSEFRSAKAAKGYENAVHNFSKLFQSFLYWSSMFNAILLNSLAWPPIKMFEIDMCFGLGRTLECIVLTTGPTVPGSTAFSRQQGVPSCRLQIRVSRDWSLGVLRGGQHQVVPIASEYACFVEALWLLTHERPFSARPKEPKFSLITRCPPQKSDLDVQCTWIHWTIVIILNFWRDRDIVRIK